MRRSESWIEIVSKPSATNEWLAPLRRTAIVEARIKLVEPGLTDGAAQLHRFPGATHQARCDRLRSSNGTDRPGNRSETSNRFTILKHTNVRQAESQDGQHRTNDQDDQHWPVEKTGSRLDWRFDDSLTSFLHGRTLSSWNEQLAGRC